MGQSSSFILAVFNPVWHQLAGENHGGKSPTALYSAILLMCAVSYFLLQNTILRHAEKRHELITELKDSKKGIVSLTFYALAVIFAFYNPIISDVLIVFVSLMWFIPDKRIEKFL